MSSIPDRGTIVGRVFSPTRQLVRFPHHHVPFFQNSEFIWNIVPWGSSKYGPSGPFLYEVTSYVKNCHFGDYYYYKPRAVCNIVCMTLLMRDSMYMAWKRNEAALKVLIIFVLMFKYDKL